MAQPKIGLLNPDSSQVQDLSSLSVGDFFNQHFIPLAQRFEAPSGSPERSSMGSDPLISPERDFSVLERDFQADNPVLVKPQRPVMVKPGQGAQPVEDDFLGEDPRSSQSIPSDLTGFVKQFEGWNPNAFDDFKQTSIGYGTRARKGEKTITRAEGERRLGHELAKHRKRVTDHAAKHGYSFSPRQIDALTSFDYNTGRLNQLTAGGTRNPAQIAAKIPAYRKAGGKVLRGLVRRRKAEQEMFNSGNKRNPRK